MMLLFYYQNYLFQNTLRNLSLIIIAFILVALVSYFLIRIRDTDKKTNLIVLGAMLLIFMIVGISWVLKMPQTQISDFGNFWSRAPGFFNGDPLYNTDNDYFSKYAYQSGFMVYILGIVKVFGFNIFVVQFLNVVYQTLTLLMTYLLVTKIFNNIKMARISVLLLMIDLDWFALSSQADNQYLGSLLYLVTLYLLMQNKTTYYLLAGISLTAACLIRPIGPVFIAGIIVFALCYLLINNGKFDYKSASKTILTLLIYFVLFSLAGWGVKAGGVNAYGLSNHDPEWKFVTGLHYQSSGTYSDDMNKLIDANKSRAEMSKVEKKQLHREIKYLNDNHKWLHLFINKVQVLWSARTLATDFTNFSTNHSPKTVEIINFIAYIGSIILIVLSWIGSFYLFKTKFSNNFYLLILPLMAFVVANLIIEVQGRYRIEFLPSISMIASLGLYNILSKFHFKKSN
ncbi:glycosyltransferase family 39 protein [Companilactobacillus sp. HBUAS59699]|uniref:glycosyltransferase family 39 protein n=1 Tax=Companilactobacillus sp. HBUAS59699 TaxID=3109358 RepID=UPI002FF3814F